MTTFSGTVVNYLVGRGMFETQANAVLENLKSDESQESMRGRWDESVDDYPPIMAHLILLSVDVVAVEWIDANIPLAWYRPMFGGEKTKRNF